MFGTLLALFSTTLLPVRGVHSTDQSQITTVERTPISHHEFTNSIDSSLGFARLVVYHQVIPSNLALPNVIT